MDDPIESMHPIPADTTGTAPANREVCQPPVIQEPLRWEVWKMGDSCRVAAFVRRVDACEYIDARHYAYVRLVEAKP